MKTLFHWIIFVIVIAVSVCPGNLNAQTTLERISVAERGDQLGYVIRFHLTKPVERFISAQPETNHVQIGIFSPDLQTSEYISPEHTIIGSFSKIDLENGAGFEFRIDMNHHFISNAYLDVNGRDLLLNLQFFDRDGAMSFVADSEEIQWPEYTTQPDVAEERAEEELPEVDRIEQRVRETPETQSGFRELLNKRNPVVFDRITPGDPFELYMRFIRTNRQYHSDTSYNLRPSAVQNSDVAASLPESHPWMNHSFFSDSELNTGIDGLVFFTPGYFLSHNNQIPWGQNDGALWQGAGLNYKIDAGVGYQYGPFSIVFRPVITHSANDEFPLSRIPVKRGLHEMAMPLTYIDSPLRFGDEPVGGFNLGDSFIQLDYAGLSAGFSNERIWTGPAIYNPLIFSTNAPGFLHGYIGTSEPYLSSAGAIEAKWLWGGLQESNYFDENESNNLRYVTSLMMSYSPSFIPGLHIGFTRASYSYFPDGGLQIYDLFQVLRLSQSKHDPNEVSPEKAFVSMMSFFGRMELPGNGFEVYAEWGRNDDKRALRDLISEPELNRGYVLGLMKRFTISGRKRILFNSEITNLENTSVGPQFRDFNIWYTNNIIQQGFTHKGQVLGAGIGPGSATQMAQVSYYDSWGMVSTSITRVAHHNDRHFRHKDFFLSRDYVGFEGALLTSRHEIEFRYGFTGLIFLPYHFELQANYTIGKIDNRYNRRLNDLNNYHLSFTLRYQLPGFLR